MTLALSRRLLVGTAAVFQGYLVLVGVLALTVPRDPGPAIVAMVLCAVATAVGLAVPGWRLPLGVAIGTVVVVVAMVLLVTSQLDPGRAGGNGYATWYVGASGVLLTVCATRGRGVSAVVGLVVLLVHTIVWAGPGAVVEYGLVGSLTWVAVALVIRRGMVAAARESLRFEQAAREAADWRARQDAHTLERRRRLAQTAAMAAPLLERIRAAGGALTAEEVAECLLVEASLRDEIRGRRLLDDRVRDLVRRARVAGAQVSVLDDGGLEDVDAQDRERILTLTAEAIEACADADRVVIRSVADGDVAVTVAGLRSGGAGPDDDELVLWREIPRA